MGPLKRPKPGGQPGGPQQWWEVCRGARLLSSFSYEDELVSHQSAVVKRGLPAAPDGAWPSWRAWSVFWGHFQGPKTTPKSGACFGPPGKEGFKPLLLYEGGPKIRVIFGSNFGSRLGRVVFVFGARAHHLARIEFQRQPAITIIFSVGHDLVPQGGKNNHDGYHAH